MIMSGLLQLLLRGGRRPRAERVVFDPMCYEEEGDSMARSCDAHATPVLTTYKSYWHEQTWVWDSERGVKLVMIGPHTEIP